MVAVEGDLGLRQVLQRPGQIRLRHVLANLLDPRHLAAVGLKEAGKRLHGALIATLADIHRATVVQIGKHRHVVLPALGARLIDPRPLKPREVLRLDRLADVVVHHPPDPHVRLADQHAHRRDRHLLDQRHHQRLEQQREPGPLPRPRHLDLMHLVLRTADPRHPRRQVRLMLEEVQMPPGLLLGVVHLAPLPTALRAREPRPLRKVDSQIQPALLGVELDIHHPPRLLKTERLLEQLAVAQTGLPSSRIRSPAPSQPPRTATHSERGGATLAGGHLSGLDVCGDRNQHRHGSKQRAHVSQSDASKPKRSPAREGITTVMAKLRKLPHILPAARAYFSIGCIRTRHIGRRQKVGCRCP